MWLALGAAPKVEKQNASAEDRYYQVGLLTGNGYAANAVYHLWGSRASERGSTPLNGDPWWQLQWSTKAVDKITTKALQDHIDGVNWKEKPYFDLEAYTEREDGAGLYPEFDLGTSGSEYQAVLLTDGPIRKNYVEGDYLTLSGLNVWQDVGFHVEEGAKYPYFEITQGANLINKPLPAGEYQFAVRASNGYRVTYKITVKPTEHIYISATTEPTLHGAWLHESDVPALRPDEAGRRAGGAGPRCRDGRRRPADVRFRRLDRGQPLRALRRGLHGADDGPVYGRACPCGHTG